MTSLKRYFLRKFSTNLSKKFDGGQQNDSEEGTESLASISVTILELSRKSGRKGQNLPPPPQRAADFNAGFAVHIFLHEQCWFVCLLVLQNFVIKVICSREGTVFANSSSAFVKCSWTVRFQHSCLKIQNFQDFAYLLTPLYRAAQCCPSNHFEVCLYEWQCRYRRHKNGLFCGAT